MILAKCYYTNLELESASEAICTFPDKTISKPTRKSVLMVKSTKTDFSLGFHSHSLRVGITDSVVGFAHSVPLSRYRLAGNTDFETLAPTGARSVTPLLLEKPQRQSR